MTVYRVWLARSTHDGVQLGVAIVHADSAESAGRLAAEDAERREPPGPDGTPLFRFAAAFTEAPQQGAADADDRSACGIVAPWSPRSPSGASVTRLPCLNSYTGPCRSFARTESRFCSDGCAIAFAEAYATDEIERGALSYCPHCDAWGREHDGDPDCRQLGGSGETWAHEPWRVPTWRVTRHLGRPGDRVELVFESDDRAEARARFGASLVDLPQGTLRIVPAESE